MPVPHAPVPSHAPDATPLQAGSGLRACLKIPDPCKRRSRRFALAFTLAVALMCVLAGARSLREIGDQAAELPQDVLAALDVIAVGWLRSLAAARKPARPAAGSAEHVAINGKWLLGVGDGQVKLCSPRCSAATA